VTAVIDTVGRVAGTVGSHAGWAADAIRELSLRQQGGRLTNADGSESTSNPRANAANPS
jgi:hypothetical protein